MQYKVTVQITEQLSRQEYSEHCQTFKTQRFGKKKSNKKWNQEPGHFDKLFLKNTRKTRRAGKHFGVFSLTLKTIFLIHYSPVLLTYTLLKHPKTFRFLHVHQAFERSLRF